MSRRQAIVGLRRARRRQSAGGFSLLEAVLSIAIIAVIMGGMSSVMLLASRSLNSRIGDVSVSAEVVDEIVGDLNLAESITEQTATAVTVVVPDRDGDSQPETIRYSWSGTPGDPLMRQVNASAAVAVAENVQQFRLDYVTRTVGGG
jgi:hypothetical protein